MKILPGTLSSVLTFFDEVCVFYLCDRWFVFSDDLDVTETDSVNSSPNHVFEIKKTGEGNVVVDASNGTVYRYNILSGEWGDIYFEGGKAESVYKFFGDFILSRPGYELNNSSGHFIYDLKNKKSVTPERPLGHVFNVNGTGVLTGFHKQKAEAYLAYLELDSGKLRWERSLEDLWIVKYLEINRIAHVWIEDDEGKSFPVFIDVESGEDLYVFPNELGLANGSDSYSEIEGFVYIHMPDGLVVYDVASRTQRTISFPDHSHLTRLTSDLIVDGDRAYYVGGFPEPACIRSYSLADGELLGEVVFEDMIARDSEIYRLGDRFIVLLEHRPDQDGWAYKKLVAWERGEIEDPDRCIEEEHLVVEIHREMMESGDSRYRVTAPDGLDDLTLLRQMLIGVTNAAQQKGRYTGLFAEYADMDIDFDGEVIADVSNYSLDADRIKLFQDEFKALEEGYVLEEFRAPTENQSIRITVRFK